MVIKLDEKLKELYDKYEEQIDFKESSTNLSHEELQDLYDKDAIGCVVFDSRVIIDTDYTVDEVRKVEHGLSVNITDLFGISRSDLDARRILLDRIKESNCIDDSGKLYFEGLYGAVKGTVYENAFNQNTQLICKNVEKYIGATKLLCKETARMVGIYHSNGETIGNYKFDAPKNLIGFAFLEDKDIDTSNEIKDVLIDTVIGGAPGVLTKVASKNKMLRKLLAECADAFSDINKTIKNVAETGVATEVSNITKEKIDSKRKILDENIIKLTPYLNLDGVETEDKELISTASFVAATLASFIPLGAGLPAIVAGGAIAGGITYFTNLIKSSQSKTNGLSEYERYKQLEQEGINYFPNQPNTKLESDLDVGINTIVGNSTKQNIIHGSKNADRIKVISGTDNRLYGGNGEDELISSLHGTILMDGGEKNDTYIYRGGDATIKDYQMVTLNQRNVIVNKALNTGDDTLVMERVLESDVEYFQQGNNLLIIINDNWQDKVCVENYYLLKTRTQSLIEKIRFKNTPEESPLSLNTHIQNKGCTKLIEGATHNGEISIMKNQKYQINNLESDDELKFFIDGMEVKPLKSSDGKDLIIKGQDDKEFVYVAVKNAFDENGDLIISSAIISFYNESETLETFCKGKEGFLIPDYHFQKRIDRPVIDYKSGTGNSEYDIQIDYPIADFKLIKNGMNMIIKKDDANQITVKYFFTSVEGKFKSLTFKDGSNRTTMTGSDIANMFRNMSEEHPIVIESDNKYSGTSGDDVLIGNSNNNTFYGGKGTDTFNGGEGRDTYIIKKGDGNTTIEDYDETPLVKDKISFADRDKNDVTFSDNGNDLIISAKNDDNEIEKVTVKDYYKKTNGQYHHKVEEITFENKTFTIDELYKPDDSGSTGGNTGNTGNTGSGETPVMEPLENLLIMSKLPRKLRGSLIQVYSYILVFLFPSNFSDYLS